MGVPGPTHGHGLPEIPQQAQAAQTAEVQRQAQQASAKGDMVAAAAKKYLGVQYAWGGEGPGGVDCSGLVQLAYKAAGIQPAQGVLPAGHVRQDRADQPVAGR